MTHCGQPCGAFVGQVRSAYRRAALTCLPAQRHVQYRPIALHEVAQPFWHGQYLLVLRQARVDVVRQVRFRLHHASGFARGADAMALGHLHCGSGARRTRNLIAPGGLQGEGCGSRC